MSRSVTIPFPATPQASDANLGWQLSNSVRQSLVELQELKRKVNEQRSWHDLGCPSILAFCRTFDQVELKCSMKELGDKLAFGSAELPDYYAFQRAWTLAVCKIRTEMA